MQNFPFSLVHHFWNEANTCNDDAINPITLSADSHFSSLCMHKIAYIFFKDKEWLFVLELMNRTCNAFVTIFVAMLNFFLHLTVMYCSASHVQ